MTVEFLRAHWRKLLVAAAYVAAFLAGYASATGPSPAPVVVEQQRVDEEIEQHVETSQDVRTDEREVVVVYRDRVVEPSGQVREQSIETRTRDRATVEQVVEQATRAEVREVERIVEVRPDPPDWRVTGLVGLQPRLLPPSPGPVVFGAQVERRVTGPVWIGAWGLSNGTVGVGVSVEF